MLEGIEKIVNFAGQYVASEVEPRILTFLAALRNIMEQQDSLARTGPCFPRLALEFGLQFDPGGPCEGWR